MNFWALNKPDRLYRLENFTKFLVVREPFERLLSAYRDKLQQFSSKKYQKISSDIHQRYSNSNNKGMVTLFRFCQYF